MRQRVFLLQSVSIALDWRRNVFNVELAFQECERHKPRILSNCRRGKYLQRKANQQKGKEKDRTHFILNQVLQFESTLPPKSAFRKPPHFHFLENWAWHSFFVNYDNQLTMRLPLSSDLIIIYSLTTEILTYLGICGTFPDRLPSHGLVP